MLSNLLARGITACTSTNGVDGALGSTLQLPDLAGKTILVCGDADEAGERLNREFPCKLYAASAAEVRLMQWPAGSP